MKVNVVQASVTEVACDALVVNLFEGVEHPGGATGAVDTALGGLLTGMIADGELKGKLGTVRTVHSQGKLPARRVLVVGLGKTSDFTLDRARHAAAAAAQASVDLGCKRVASITHGAGIGGLDPAQCARAVVEGTILGTYHFEGYSRDPEPRPGISEFELVEHGAEKIRTIEKGARLGEVLARATNDARDLGNRPANKLTPAAFADEAQAMATDMGLACKVVGRSDMEREGMGAFLGVARGSDEPPKMIVLTYEPAESSGETLALVGKALTFDSGGLSLKSGAGMIDMKFDMCGGAAVFGAMKAIAELKPNRKVLGLICATENMPGGHAQRPGDVVKGLSGKTIEVLNTDAEGRLVLADGVAYAEKLGADQIVDIATLTGAVMVVLGREAAAVLANDDVWAQTVVESGARAGERFWQLPAWPEYRELFKSEVADLKNIGGRDAGTITGGLIIGEFVENATWAHLDIAGVAWTDKNKGYNARGATGFGLRTLVELALR